MDKYLEIGRNIRITSFDNLEETKRGKISSFNSSEIVIAFELSQSLKFIQEDRDKIFNISLANVKNLVKFSSKIINIDKNIVTIEKPFDFQIIQRREYTRVNTEIPVIFFDKNGNSFHCFTNNISGGGMQVSTSCVLVLGESFEVEIKFKNYTVKAFLEVLRIEKNIEKNQYFIAGIFKKIQNVDRIYLIQSCFKKQLELRSIEL
ncbi:MAG: PilZ domain-containing protein [Candidatus Gastranaerophilaceae bacterium]|jgi:c-di-GMP-binding flagellar brake protein YcgR